MNIDLNDYVIELAMANNPRYQNVYISCFGCGKHKVIWKGIVGEAFLEISLEILRLQEFVGSVVKVGIGLMNADRQETCNVILYQWGNSLSGLAYTLATNNRS